MRYIRGDQTYKIEDLPKTKCRVIVGGDVEGPWCAQAKDHVVMLNSLLAFHPFPSWGLILPSKNPQGNIREDFDVTELRGNSPDGVELTVHPEAWDEMRRRNIIDSEGEFIYPKDRPVHGDSS